MNLSKKEISLIKDKDFLLTKSEIIRKMESIFRDTESSINKQINEISFDFPNDLKLNSGKISKGENYNGLPYLVLDYPALFKKNNVFAYRTMFWWGNFLSSTLHLQHESLDRYRDQLIKNFDKLFQMDVHISVGESPWEYHYNQTNYQKISKQHRDHIIQCRFIKLSKMMDLDNYKELPKFSSEFFSEILNALS